MTPVELGLGEVDVVYWGLEDADRLQLASLQPDELREDLIQARLRDGQLLDVGWYPAGATNGAFRVLVVSDSNWDSPLFEASATTWDELERAISSALAAREAERR